MANAAHTFEGSSPSMRGVRDKYLALLLSGGREVPPSSSMPPSWTPGQQLPKYSDAPWASPTTPVPTENDVRLAEIAAGLVAAGGVEKRQADTIRRLATQLERSEKKLRVLQTGDKRRVRGMSTPSPSKYYDDVPVVHNETRRSIHFTPKTTRKESSHRRVEDSQKRSSSSRSARHGTRDPYKDLEELEDLRREREEWLRNKDRSEREAESLSKLLADIKNNTQKLMKERNDHLKVIARLQSELSDVKLHAGREASGRFDDARTIEFSPRPVMHENSPRSPQPVFTMREELSYGDGSVDELHRGASPASVHHSNFDGGVNRSVYPVVVQREEAAGVQAEVDREKSTSSAELRLRQELEQVVAENARYAQRTAILESDCKELYFKLQETEQMVEKAKKGDSEGQVEKEESSEEDRLAPLLGEVDILEGIASAISFSVCPREAERLQETMTLVDGAIVPAVESCETGEEEYHANMTQSEKISWLVRRLITVRSGLCERYGQWLGAIANDGISSNESTRALTDGVDTREIDNEVSMDTALIDKLINK